MCDRVAFVREGELVAVEDVAELMGRAVREIEVVFAEPVPPSAFEGVPGVTDVVADGKDAATLRLTVTGSLDPLVKALAALPGRRPHQPASRPRGRLHDLLRGRSADGTRRRRCCVTPSSRGCATSCDRSLMWAVGVAFYVALLISIYPSIRKSAGAIQEYVEEHAGGASAPRSWAPATSPRPVGYVNVELLSWLAPIVLIGFAVAVAARSLAGEEESGTLGLVLTHRRRAAAVRAAEVRRHGRGGRRARRRVLGSR